ncbi:MAG: cytochrome P450 [Porticoccaceae bacterium]|jgi:cytochrome P450
MLEAVNSSEPVIPDEIAQIVTSSASYTDDNIIYPAFKWLRENMPVGRAYVEGYDPIWVVTKYTDIKAISLDNDTFINGDHNLILNTIAADDFIRKDNKGKIRSMNSLAFMDAPEHPTYRAVTASWFQPDRIRNLEGQIRETARQSVQEMFDHNGSCDFVKDIALYYPLRVIMDILGCPREDEKLILKLTQQLFGGDDPDEQRTDIELTPDAAGRAWRATLNDFKDYFREISLDRRKNPREDLISLIANAKVDGEYIDEDRELDYYIAVATGGHDTTSSSTSGGLLGLIRYPEEFKKFKENPGLSHSFTNEAIRWATPIKHFMRAASRDTEVHGQKIKKNDRLMLCYPSANRDEEFFKNPDAFIVDRRPNQHLAFGNGAHMCIGQHLAKLDIRLLFEELMPRLESVELAGTPTFVQSTFASGLKSLPIRYVMK